MPLRVKHVKRDAQVRAAGDDATRYARSYARRRNIADIVAYQRHQQFRARSAQNGGGEDAVTPPSTMAYRVHQHSSSHFWTEKRASRRAALHQTRSLRACAWRYHLINLARDGRHYQRWTWP